LRRPNIPALTSMRFFAAILVVIFHYNAASPIFPFGISHFGFESVTFFFILSGFILTYTHATDTGLNISGRDFLAARIARIAPAYFLALALALPFFIRSGPAPSVPLVLSMTQAWVPPYALSWNIPAWSLSNEMSFYLCYPAILWASSRVSSVVFCVGAALLVIATALWREVYFVSEDWHNFRSYFPLLNLPQFIVGIALGKLFIEGVKPHRAMFALGVTALVAIIYFIRDFRWLSNTAILSAVFSVTIFGACRPIVFLSGRALVLLGDASYALYILHDPFWMWWDRIVRVSLKLNFPPPIDAVLYLAGVVSMSAFVTIYFERPIRRALLTRRIVTPPSPAT
jgi:peptidoglycan/LPS O-acetylase OafA/YrhL